MHTAVATSLTPSETDASAAGDGPKPFDRQQERKLAMGGATSSPASPTPRSPRRTKPS